MKSPNPQLHAFGITTLCKNILFSLILISSVASFAQQLAFPKATGAAAYVTGGRGGTVIHVTNLNNSGPGSFREAFTTSGTRTIVFDVSGTINCTSSLSTAYGNVTVAGQTAPEGGITFTGNVGNSPIFEVSGKDNMIFRYIRIRPTFNNTGSNADAFQFYNCTNVIVDHCSISWGGDECVSFTGATNNISIQNSILGESKTGSIMGNGNNAATASNLSMNGNLFFQIDHRHPNSATNGRADVINNVIWGYGYRTNRPAPGYPQLNEIGNYYITNTARILGDMGKIDYFGVEPQIYSKGNLHLPSTVTDQNLPNNNNTWTAFGSSNGAYAFNYNGVNYYDDDPAPSSFFSSSQHTLLGEAWPIMTALESLEYATTKVGANKSLDGSGGTITNWDIIDEYYLTNVANGTLLTVAYPFTMAGKSHYVNYLNTISSTPINTRPNNYDTDNDGMADEWEIDRYNTLSHNGTADTNNNGYTDLEEFLNGVDLPDTGEVVDNQVTVSSNVSNNTICNGEDVILTASDADSYVWILNGETSESITVTPNVTTTYIVEGTHSDGSPTQAEITITVNDLPVADAGLDVETCQGTPVTLTANGGTSYLWNTGATTQSISVNPNTTTNYSVITTQNNCDSEPDEVTVTVNPLPNVDAGLDQTINFGESIELTASGADTYLWSTGETTQSITVSPEIETTYTVTGTIDSCINTDSVTVFIIGSEVVANAGEDQTICNGLETTLTATGGVAYVWNTGETTASINVSPSNTTTYTVTAFDTTGTVSDTDDVTVTVNALPNVNAGIDVTITEGESTTLTASGADTYVWSTGETTQSIVVSPDADTIYTVTGFLNGCEASDEVIVNIETENVVANAGADVSICEGESVTLTALGGATYQWSTGETTSSIEVSPSTTTTYSVTAFNTLGTDSDTDDVTVTVNALPNVNAGIDVTITEGGSTTLTASGADTYVWSTGETTQSIVVSPGADTTYIVTGFLNGCEATDDVFVNLETENIVANAGADVSICEGESVTLTASGGTTYQWSTGETTSSIEVSPSTTTTYSVTAFNTLGTDSDTDDVTVTVNALPNVNAGIDVTITEGGSTTLTASGADTYVWSTGETTQSIVVSPDADTIYTVTGFLNGCEATDDVFVNLETENIVANAGADVSICEGESVTLTALGGATYQWSTGETTSSIEVSPSTTTTYSVTAFNTLGTDSDTDNVTVTVNALPSVNAGTDVTITEGESTTLTVSGADTYVWNTGETTQSISVSPTSTTTYSVTGFLNGCEATDEVIVIVETENVAANAGADVSICEGESVTLTASGGTTYQWSTGETTSSIEVSPSTTTTYSVTAFNTLGTDSDTDDVTVTVNALPSVNAGTDVTITEGESTTLTASGADTYVWNSGETTQSITVNPSETTLYSVTGFSNGCEATDEVLVTVEPIVFTANAGEDQFICEGTSTTLTASEGDAYLWSTGETTQSINVSPWASETYTVTVFEGEEQAQDDVSVFVNLNPNVVILNGGEVTILEGEFITLSASGANTYEWNNGATQPNIAVSPSLSTTFSVTGYINNCSDQKSVTVNVVEAVEAYAGEDHIICVNEMVTLTANGGDEYLWNTGETTQSIQVTPGEDTEYSVLVYNELSSDEDTVMVYVNDCDPVEIPEVEQVFNFLVYQDVSADVLKVKISGMDRVDVDQLVIYDISGKILYREHLKTNENTISLDKEIDSSQFSRGIYIVRLIYDDTEILKKIPIR